MQFLEKNKKKLFLIGSLLLIVALIGPVANLLNGVIITVRPYIYASASFNISGLFNMFFRNIGSFISTALACVLSFATIACFAFGAFQSSRNEKRSIFTAIGGGLMAAGVVYGVIVALVSCIVGIVQALEGYGGAAMIGTFVGSLVGTILGNFGTVVLAAYFIVCYFVKPKGIAVPIVGAALIGVFMVAGSVFGLLSPFAVFAQSLPWWMAIPSFLLNAVAAIGGCAYSLGLLLHVPMSYYEPKVTVAEIVEEATETVEE